MRGGKYGGYASTHAVPDQHELIEAQCIDHSQQIIRARLQRIVTIIRCIRSTMTTQVVGNRAAFITDVLKLPQPVPGITGQRVDEDDGVLASARVIDIDATRPCLDVHALEEELGESEWKRKGTERREI